jgi:hypothetical protein
VNIFPNTISRTELARSTCQAIEEARRGQTILVESYGLIDLLVARPELRTEERRDAFIEEMLAGSPRKGHIQGPITFDDLPAGETYYFRVRGTDGAQNQESWSAGNGDTSTAVYATAIRGVVQDNSGMPIEGIALTTNPASFYTVPGDENGRYATFLATQPSTFTSNWAKNGMGRCPPPPFPA